MNSLYKNMSLAFLPLNHPQREFGPLYHSASQVWREVWSKVNERFNLPTPAYLDNLLRQDEAACIFDGTKCIAMILFRIVDFSILDYSGDSYFKEWSKTDIEKLVAEGSRVFISSYLTVDPNFRNFAPDLKFKAILLNIMIKRFLESEADVIAGITRRDRDINGESFKLGADLVNEDVAYFDGRERVDLVCFYRSKAVESENPAVREFTNTLWKSRLDPAHREKSHLRVA
jgi:hypothetical protein